MTRPYSDRVKYTVSETLAMQLDAAQFDVMANLAITDAGSKRVEQWLRESGLYNKCRVGVIGVIDNSRTRLLAHCKVIVLGTQQHFFHEETYSQFPSDHFKTKVLLATGG